MRIRVWKADDQVWQWSYTVSYKGRTFTGKAGSREVAWVYARNAVEYFARR